LPIRVGSFDYRPMAADMAGEFPTLRHVVVAGEPGPNQTAYHTLSANGPADGRLLDQRRPDPSDVSTMLLSGGTTSLSKLIPRTHNDYVYNARVCAEVAGFLRGHGVHGHAAAGAQLQPGVPGMLGTFHAGGTLVIARNTDAGEVFGTVARERVTNLAAVVPLITDVVE
jgi:2,3-dihydroxybenzoate-AMP ligase